MNGAPRPPHPFDGTIVVAGPTASGKTALAIELAERIGAEVIGADSQQLYADLPVTTCQPTETERARIPHHLVGVLPATERMSAARYGQLARAAAAEIRARGLRVLLVGGTGLYLRAAIQGLFEGPAANPELRAALVAEAERDGREKLHARLAALDPEAAARLSPNDLLRVIRSLEIHALTGQSQSEHHRKHQRGQPAVTWFAVGVPRETLYGRIAERTRAMYPALLGEARRLGVRGLQASPAARALGISEALRALAGELSQEEAIELTIQATRRYAKRQLTWFRKEKQIQWLEPGELPSGELTSGIP